MNDPRYPIGQFKLEGEITEARRRQWIDEIAAAPAGARQAVQGLSPAQLDTSYRPGGWTVRQVIHHLPESHMNAYIRFKLALTESNPTVKPYNEAAWAETVDSRTEDPEASLMILEGLHRRWVRLMSSLKPADWDRTYFHPENGMTWRLDHVLAMYAWHGRHHVAHITALRERNGWR